MFTVRRPETATRYFLPPAVELPGKRAADDGVDEVNAFVPRLAQLVRVRGATAHGEIGWSGAGQHSGLEQPPGNEGRWLWLAETQRSIEAVGDKVTDAVAPQDLQRQPRMGRQKFADARGEDKASKKGIDIDPQPAAHGHGGARRLDGGVLDAGEVRLHSLIEASPFLGERDRARRAVE